MFCLDERKENMNSNAFFCLVEKKIERKKKGKLTFRNSFKFFS